MYHMRWVRLGVEELVEMLEKDEINQAEFDKIAKEVVDTLLTLVGMDEETPDDNFIAFVEHYTY